MAKDRRRSLVGVAVAGLTAAALMVPVTTGAQSPSAAAPVLPTLPAPEKSTIKIGLSVAEPSQFAAKLAQAAGFFEDVGLTLDPNDGIVVFEGDGKTLQALQAGQLDIGFIGVSAAINTQVTDAPVQILSTNATILSDNLISVADVTNADELRGKCVAVSTYGGTSHGSAILSLQELGLTPEDVVITEIGGQAARIAALEGGACQAAVVDVNLRADMEALGFHALTDLKQARLPWGRSGLGVTKEWLAANPNTALAALAAVLRGQNTYWADPEFAAQTFADFNQIDLESAQALVADFQEIGNRPMTWVDEAFTNPQRILATVNPDIATVDISTAYDRGPIQSLIDMGYYDALGIPLE